MSISYKKLWKLLIDRDMKKKIYKNLRGLAPFWEVCSGSQPY